ncbi:YdeI/OmpD-associated family protein [Clostridium septicum]|uniref:YdeI/OmpD-associated family protein n=1 Tax=Clostridium septicum TaxID=1504 RepID=UPI00272E8E2B|nr:YdeI/OmpD-associated family protein [Clostridium septicum]WLF68613.1 YdeI/OmpD-associated family protein [Clostridium septicum]
MINFNVEKVLGAKTVKVKVTFDGVEYRGSIVKMGGGCHIIGVTKEIRGKINKDFGDMVLVTVEKDEEERVVQVPEDLELELARDKEINDTWNSMSFLNRKKYVNWIVSAKREETRSNRVKESLRMLKNKKSLIS